MKSDSPLSPGPGGLGRLRETLIVPGVSALFAPQGEELPLRHQTEGGGGVFRCLLDGLGPGLLQGVQQGLLGVVFRLVGVQDLCQPVLLLLTIPGVGVVHRGGHHNVGVLPGAVREDGQRIEPGVRVLQEPPG